MNMQYYNSVYFVVCLKNRERANKRFCTKWWNASQPTIFQNVNPKL